MAAWIIDASVAVKWFVRDLDSPAANRLIFDDHDLLAPDLIQIEFANAMRKYVRAHVLSASDAAAGLTSMPRLFRHMIPTGPLLGTAFDLACSLAHPIYDCIYLAAALQSAMPVVTADAAFIAKVSGTAYAPNVVLLSNIKP